MSDYNTFRCPNCNQFINDTLSVCTYCSIPLDQGAIRNSVDKQKRLDDAYRSASNIRILAGAMTTFFFVGFLPFLGFVSTWAFRVTFLCIPIFLIVWLVKYSGLSSIEQEIKDARKYLLTAFGIWLIYPVVYILLLVLVVLGITAYQLSQ